MGDVHSPALPQRRRYYFDTNALLARFLTRVPGSAMVRALCEPDAHHTLLLAEITEVELCATLNQLRRGGGLRTRTCERLITIFWQQTSAGEYAILPITTEIVRRAAALCAVHSLRGYDAVQLSCALVARDAARLADADADASAEGVVAGDPIFLTADKRLQQAVLAEGFVLLDPTSGDTN
jgi:predicted nucleic acid-binding protein